MACGTGTTHLCWWTHAGMNLHDPSLISLTRYFKLASFHMQHTFQFYFMIAGKRSHQFGCVSAELRPHVQPLGHLRGHHCRHSGIRCCHFSRSHQSRWTYHKDIHKWSSQSYACLLQFHRPVLPWSSLSLLQTNTCSPDIQFESAKSHFWLQHLCPPIPKFVTTDMKSIETHLT